MKMRPWHWKEKKQPKMFSAGIALKGLVLFWKNGSPSGIVNFRETIIMRPDKNLKYKAIVSSDWSECLSPNGPFDFISFAYPELETDLKNVFKQYTGNIISLGAATQKIQKLLQDPINEEHMDAYLDASFVTYRGVADLIESRFLRVDG